MSVKIKMSQLLQQYTNKKDTVEVNGSTVTECLNDLVKQYPDVKQWLFDKNGILMVLVLLNGETINQKNLNRTVTEKDKLQIVLVIGGG